MRSNRFNSSRGKIACCIYLLQLVVECYFLKGDICISEFEHDSKFGIWIDFLDERDVINAIMIKIQFDEGGVGGGGRKKFISLHKSGPTNDEKLEWKETGYR